MTKWEYLTVLTTENVTNISYNWARFGDKGWELVSVILAKNGPFTLIFKRPKQ